jgi:hypothetical protein
MIMLLTSKDYPYVENIATPLVFFRAHSGSITITNENNDVTKGYRSAFAFYLRANCNYKRWMDYVSYSWLQQMKSDGKLLSPKSYLREYEGAGSFVEVLEMIGSSIRQGFGRVFMAKKI